MSKTIDATALSEIEVIGPRTPLVCAMQQVLNAAGVRGPFQLLHNFRVENPQLIECWERLAAVAGSDLLVLHAQGTRPRNRPTSEGRASVFEVQASSTSDGLLRLDLDHTRIGFAEASAKRALSRNVSLANPLEGNRGLLGVIREIKRLADPKQGKLDDESVISWMRDLLRAAGPEEPNAWKVFLMDCLANPGGFRGLDLYYMLLLVTLDEERWQHDEAHLAAARLEEPMQFAVRSYRMWDRRSLDSVRQICERPFRVRPEGNLKVLVVDDNPKWSGDALSLLGAVLHPSPTPEWSEWLAPKTAKGDEAQSLDRDFFLHYQCGSLSKQLEGALLASGVRGRFNHERPDATLGSCFGWPDVVIVDQLFKNDSDSTAERIGPQLIRGLKLFFRDAQRLWDPKRKKLPEIIAISQSDDPEVIQDALRAGARDFVVKSNLARLLPVLADVERLSIPVDEAEYPSLTSLERLPNRTLGMIRTLRLPRVPWDRDDGPSTQESEWLNLLRALPKAELHLHVGSCMSAEFLAVAAFFGLMLHEDATTSSVSERHAVWNEQREVWKLARTLITALRNGEKPKFKRLGLRSPSKNRSAATSSSQFGWIANVGNQLCAAIRETLRLSPNADLRELRSKLHVDLNVRDHLSDESAIAKLEETPRVRLLWFVLRNACPGLAKFKEDDLVRLVILVAGEADPLMNEALEGDLAHREEFQNLFANDGCYSVEGFRNRNWRLPPCAEDMPNWWPDVSNIAAAKLRETVATGKQSRNLREYLEGCELSGALHLKHPYLCHLYAQQVLRWFIDEGIVYAELRASPDGYANPRIGFEFPDAVHCFTEAFSSGREALSSGREAQWLLPQAYRSANGRWKAEPLRAAFSTTEPWQRRLPPRVALLFVGKRHKAPGEMIREVSAVVVERRMSFLDRSGEFAGGRCEIVGFDLAGHEPDYPPELFSSEFRRLGRLHVPITVHAGENAPAAFIESAILDLGAKRIGHALSLQENPALMNRLRDEGICVELCPVSNAQTSTFSDPGTPGRKYPIRAYVEHSIPVTLNTDNPIISGTRLSREFFQASHFWDEEGMSLWTALSLIKNGFTHAFVPLPIRKELLEAVEERIFDLFEEEYSRNWMEKELSRP